MDERASARTLRSVAGPIDQSPSLREQTHARLREAILEGALPVGARLSAGRIAEELGVSTMPVRQALMQLIDEGLVESSARRWTRVAVPDRGLADELYPLVGVLEEFAVVTLPAPSPDLLAALRAANEELGAAVARRDVLPCVHADQRFHEILVGANANATLRATLEELKGRMRLLEITYFQAERAHASVAQHAEIVDRLAAGEMQAAGEAVRKNWLQALDVLGSGGPDVAAEPARAAPSGGQHGH